MLCGVYSMLVFACTTYTLGRVYAIMLVWSVLGYLVAAPRQENTIEKSAVQTDCPTAVQR